MQAAEQDPFTAVRSDDGDGDEQASTDRLDIAGAVASLASIVLAHESFELVLEHLTGIAKRTVPGAFEVSITMRDRDPFTVATTAEFAAIVDASQYAPGTVPAWTRFVSARPWWSMTSPPSLAGPSTPPAPPMRAFAARSRSRCRSARNTSRP